MLLTPTPPVNGNNDYGSYDNYAGGGGQTEEPYEPDYGVFVDDEPTEPPDKQEDQEHNYTEEPVEEMAFDKPNDDVYNGDVIDIPHVTTEPPMDTPTYSNDPPEPVATTAPSGAVLATSIKSCNGNS
jgi:hypothetical protein